MKRLILVTVGTSLRGKDGFPDGLRAFLDNLDESSDKAATTTKIFKGAYEGQAEREDKALEFLNRRQADPAELTAEIASLALMAPDSDKDHVVLLCSDTPDGAFCARVNAAYIDKYMLVPAKQAGVSQCEVRRIEGLEVGDPEKFKIGLENLYRLLEECAATAKRKKLELHINITGGYKGAIPFIAIFAYLNQLTINYFHEIGDFILKIEPVLPEMPNHNPHETDKKSGKARSKTSLKVTFESKSVSTPRPEVYL